MTLPFAIGLALAFGVAAFAAAVRLDRDRAFHATVLLVVASYYVLFAAMSGDVRAVLAEVAAMTAFAAAAIRGFTAAPWLIAAGLAAHGAFDLVHAHVITNTGVPAWWPAFCAAYDIGAGACLAWSLRRRHVRPPAPVRPARADAASSAA